MTQSRVDRPENATLPPAGPGASAPAAPADPRVARALEEYLAAAEAGRRPARPEFLRRHADIAGQLAAGLDGLDFLHAAAAELGGPAGPAGEADLGAPLGDFRLIRELGRGGMGIVYEAEQLSLQRRVALKVLPFAATMDPRQLQRFHNEARAAASLHHTNIVPVYFVGCERGVHFYAMQLIDGQPLSDFIRQCQQSAGPNGAAPAVSADRTTAYAPPGAAPSADTAPAARQSTLSAGPARGREYFRRAAEWGVQAAEALDYAHQTGVVHRDVKPANLMVDASGRLWVTDFGLAHIRQGDAGLTLTGDLVGTLRYMSPEQALAQRVVIDHRTDVYSLGATLYELLTLAPVLAGSDRQELLRQIAFEEPKPPRRLNKAVPAELETIVLKALEKNPNQRYATAQALADDLRRFLQDQPIKARRPSLAQRLGKWRRRHKAAVWAAAVVLLVVTLVGGAAGVWWLQTRAAVDAEARAALQEASRLQQQEKWPEALSAVRRAAGVLAGVGGDAQLRRQIDELGKDLEMAHRLEEARLQLDFAKDDKDWQACEESFADAFHWYGLAVDGPDPREAAEFIRSRPIRVQLVAALEDWAYMRKKVGGEGRRELLAVARAADPDRWRDRLRDALEGADPKALEALAASDPGGDLTPATAVLLARLTRGTTAAEWSTKLLRRLQQQHPGDFWLNELLGSSLLDMRPPRPEEALRYLAAAVSLRPNSAGAHLELSTALMEMGQVDDAVAEDREAVRLAPDYAAAHSNLGNSLRLKGQLGEAAAQFREAIRIKPDLVSPHFNLGQLLWVVGQLDDAVAEFHETYRLDPNSGDSHVVLGFALEIEGQPEEAIAQYREAIRLQPGLAFAHHNLGLALRKKGQLDGALDEFRQAVRLDKNWPEARFGLADALSAKGQLDEAEVEFRAALRLNPYSPDAHCHLGLMLRNQGRFREALEEVRRGHELGSRNPGWSCPSAAWVEQCRRLVEFDALWPAVVSGAADPADAGAALGFAQLCYSTKRHAAAARFSAEAFAVAPATTGDIYNAACSAALAGCGQGEGAPADQAGRAGLRAQALAWLRADLAWWRRLAAAGADKGRAAVQREMLHWQEDTDLAGVRGEAALAKLPEDERQAWQKLWADVEETLRAADKPPPQPKEGAPHKD